MYALLYATVPLYVGPWERECVNAGATLLRLVRATALSGIRQERGSGGLGGYRKNVSFYFIVQFNIEIAMIIDKGQDKTTEEIYL